ncbi:hypothetical protein BHE90_010845 [Fusarium euwallaceae]|uniref:Uncharacterized protein n=1 Tax=Fusarium euwallaceae TaxID=1147111 RepID=A0A430LG50_9HYPO|nr:hypothetical protein BHE90_010845 [Fusarium euwallaceae]
MDKIDTVDESPVSHVVGQDVVAQIQPVLHTMPTIQKLCQRPRYMSPYMRKTLQSKRLLLLQLTPSLLETRPISGHVNNQATR